MISKVCASQRSAWCVKHRYLCTFSDEDVYSRLINCLVSSHDAEYRRAKFNYEDVRLQVRQQAEKNTCAASDVKFEKPI